MTLIHVDLNQARANQMLEVTFEGKLLSHDYINTVWDCIQT